VPGMITLNTRFLKRGWERCEAPGSSAVPGAASQGTCPKRRVSPEQATTFARCPGCLSSLVCRLGTSCGVTSFAKKKQRISLVAQATTVDMKRALWPSDFNNIGWGVCGNRRARSTFKTYERNQIARERLRLDSIVGVRLRHRRASRRFALLA
jgi:hypothetical protein